MKINVYWRVRGTERERERKNGVTCECAKSFRLLFGKVAQGWKN